MLIVVSAQKPRPTRAHIDAAGESFLNRLSQPIAGRKRQIVVGGKIQPLAPGEGTATIRPRQRREIFRIGFQKGVRHSRSFGATERNRANFHPPLKGAAKVVMSS